MAEEGVREGDGRFREVPADDGTLSRFSGEKGTISLSSETARDLAGGELGPATADDGIAAELKGALRLDEDGAPLFVASTIGSSSPSESDAGKNRSGSDF